MTDKQLAQLFDRYMNQESSQEETFELLEYINDPGNEQQIKELIGDSFNHEPGIDVLPVYRLQAILREILEHEAPLAAPRHGVTKKHWSRIAVAASVLLFLSVGSYFLLHKKQVARKIALNQHHDLAPGGNKAILTLSSGEQISLSDAKNGIIAKENREIIQKAADGSIVYRGNSAATGNQPLVYNTITTPRGGQWPVVLPDGSRVMLNAASALRYPVAFTNKERVVELTGEAYFEVAHDAAKPFRVISNGQTVEVLGTHFNINAYNDEPAMVTTLLEGSVKVGKDNAVATIKPGEEAVWANYAHQFKVDQADVDAAVAWKNGLFQFNHASIESIMRQASRWYDVEISYKANIPQLTFSGNLPRNVNASRLLEILSITGVHFNIEGKKIIIVTP
jgi:transmembrane sensor